VVARPRNLPDAGDPDIDERRALATIPGAGRTIASNPRAWGDPPDQHDIPSWAEGRPFITYEPGQTLRNLVVSFLGRDGAAVAPVISTSGSSSVKRCVEEGLRYSIIRCWCAGPEDVTIDSTKLTVLPEVQVYFGCAVFLQQHPTVQQLFKDCCRELVGRVLDPPSSAKAAPALVAADASAIAS